MDSKYRERLAIPHERLDAINGVLLDPNARVMKAFLDVVAKYGTPEEINRKHAESRKFESLAKHIQERAPEHLQDLQWLTQQRDAQKFISVADYRARVLDETAHREDFADSSAV